MGEVKVIIQNRLGYPFNHTDLHPIRLGQTADVRMII